MEHQHDTHCQCRSNVAAQSLDEMEFERGIWSAALYNDLDKLKKFISLGQANCLDSAGYAPLHYAARNGHLTACELLLKAGVDVNVCTRSGGVTPLMRAAMMGHASIVELLLQKNSNTYAADNDGNTALHKAAQNNHQEVMSILIKFCNDSNKLENMCNNKGQTAKDLFSK